MASKPRNFLAVRQQCSAALCFPSVLAPLDATVSHCQPRGVAREDHILTLGSGGCGDIIRSSDFPAGLRADRCPSHWRCEVHAEMESTFSQRHLRDVWITRACGVFLYMMVWVGKQTCSEKMILKHTVSVVVVLGASQKLPVNVRLKFSHKQEKPLKNLEEMWAGSIDWNFYFVCVCVALANLKTPVFQMNTVTSALISGLIILAVMSVCFFIFSLTLLKGKTSPVSSLSGVNNPTFNWVPEHISQPTLLQNQQCEQGANNRCGMFVHVVISQESK